jgi:hypothetical protein
MQFQFTGGSAAAPSPAVYHVPEGEYTVRVKKAEGKKSQQGNPMIELSLVVLAEDGFTERSKLTDYLVFSAAALWKVEAFLKAAGRCPEDGVTLNIEPQDLIGLDVRAKLTVEERAGTKDPQKLFKNNRVESYIGEDGIPF